ncbi:hypothetical protein F2Q69_00023083 [Brassica cretica]|uniref:Uncharacterized protein n=1 Tax=Brassica cretica TaxID=69181 RepID=A0A8S9QP66_BRACR|nr:hypothetical protein F2Q69_00023083 [Brassica cretica]
MRRSFGNPELPLEPEVVLNPDVSFGPGDHFEPGGCSRFGSHFEPRGPYSAFLGKTTPGTCSDFAFCRSEAGHYRVPMMYSTSAGSTFHIGTLGTPMPLKLHRGFRQYLALYVICSLPESERVSSSGSTFALYGICSMPESERVSSSGSTFALYVLRIPHGRMDAGVGAGASLNRNLEDGASPGQDIAPVILLSQILLRGSWPEVVLSGWRET